MDASHSGREPQHWQKGGGAAFHGDGKRASEGVVVGVVVGMVSGSADAHGWTSFGRYFMSGEGEQPAWMSVSHFL